jgi:hypothetical protein
MNRLVISGLCIASTLISTLSLFPCHADQKSASEESSSASPEPASTDPVSPREARGRARLLHEVVRGALQVMHRDFFDPDDRDRIPSSSLEDMFEGVKDSLGVELRWLGVNAKVMDVDHKAKDEFEKRAVSALATGKREFESIEKNTFRFVGAIRLHNACLKCHVPFRNSLETRTAGLAISIPLRSEGKK